MQNRDKHKQGQSVIWLCWIDTNRYPNSAKWIFISFLLFTPLPMLDVPRIFRFLHPLYLPCFLSSHPSLWARTITISSTGRNILTIPPEHFPPIRISKEPKRAQHQQSPNYRKDMCTMKESPMSNIQYRRYTIIITGLWSSFMKKPLLPFLLSRFCYFLWRSQITLFNILNCFVPPPEIALWNSR